MTVEMRALSQYVVHQCQASASDASVTTVKSKMWSATTLFAEAQHILFFGIPALGIPELRFLAVRSDSWAPSGPSMQSTMGEECCSRSLPSGWLQYPCISFSCRAGSLSHFVSSCVFLMLARWRWQEAPQVYDGRRFWRKQQYSKLP